jgi:hypothetical protein
MELMVELELVHQSMAHPQQEVEAAEAEWEAEDLCSHLVGLVEAQMEVHHLAQAEAMLLQILEGAEEVAEEMLVLEETEEKVL